MSFYNTKLEHVWSLGYMGVLQPNLHGYQGWLVENPTFTTNNFKYS